MKKLSETSAKKFLKEIYEALQTYFFDINYCEHVEFKEGFYFYGTRFDTIAIQGRIFISYDITEGTIEIYDTEGDCLAVAYDYFETNIYNKAEIVMNITRKLIRRGLLGC